MPFWNNIICIQNFNVFIRFPPPPLSFPYNFCWRTCVVWPVEFLTRCLTHTFVLCVSCKLAAGSKAWSDYRWWGAFPSRGKCCLVDCHFVMLAHYQIQRSANLCEPNQIQLLFLQIVLSERSYVYVYTLFVCCLWQLLLQNQNWVVLTVLCALQSLQYLLSTSL